MTAKQGTKIAVLGIRGLPANYGGLETCAEEVCRRWAAAGHDVMVYCRKYRYEERPDSIGDVSLRYIASVPRMNLDTISHTFLCVLDLIFIKRQYKRVHLYNTGNGLFIPLLKLAGKHVVLSGDGVEWRREKWGRLAKFVHKMGEKFAAWFADHIVVDNDEVGAYYRDRHNAATDLIAYGANELEVDTELSQQLMQQYGLEPKKYFIFVGRIVPEKGVHELIEVYKRLRTDYPLVVIGDDDGGTGYREEVFSQASDSVRLIGFVYDKAYEQLLINAYMYLSASRLEGTSPSLLSAMGAGVACLVNGIPENLATLKGAIPAYRQNDLGDLEARWQAYIDDPASAEDAGRRGLECVRRYYCWDAVAADYLKLLV
jgi:glycosyltransferase involved in cell wall biosynthesis